MTMGIRQYSSLHMQKLYMIKTDIFDPLVPFLAGAFNEDGILAAHHKTWVTHFMELSFSL